MTDYAMPADRSGYELNKRDLAFLSISEAQIDLCSRRRAPLGMSEEQYQEFVRDLKEALELEGIRNVDIRFQGSSVKFFSGPHKPMPYAREQVYNCFLEETGRPPTDHELHDIHSKITAQWPTTHPEQRPFDSLLVIGLSEAPSDYDIQLSSDDAYDIVESGLRKRQLDPTQINSTNKKYAFMHKKIQEETFIHLECWAAKWWDILERPVYPVLFRSAGPAIVEDQPDLSSHFKSSDWIIQEAEDQQGDIRSAAGVR